MKILTLAFVLMMTLSTFSQTPTIESGVPQTLAKWRAANYSDVRYGLNLTLEKMSPTLKGTITVSLQNKADQIILDWRKIRGSENLSTVSKITVNGASAKYEEINEHLVFKEGVKNGENIIKLDFTSPILTSGSAITRYVDKEDGAEYLYSLFVPSDASTAFPVFDQPDLKAKFSLNVNAPEDWKVVSNTNIPVEIHVDSFAKNSKTDKTTNKPVKAGQWTFKETKPISTYVFAFAAGDFAEFSELFGLNTAKASGDDILALPNNPKELQEYLKDLVEPKPRIYVRKSQAKKFEKEAKEVFRLNREGVKFLESYFDYKFPFPKYDLVLIPEFPFGGMEHAGATFLREASVIFPTEPTKNDYVSRANVIFHEAAHQWFGDTVTMKWFDDLWLKEGFAEFMAYKTLEKVMPEYNAWKIFYERNKQAAYLTDSTKGTTPIYQEISNLSAAKSAYGNIVYRKAPSFLRQAEFYLGADKFQTAVRAFLKNHQYANAEWTDLVREFEASSNQDLKDWANNWVKKRGVPTVRIGVTSTKRSGELEPVMFHGNYSYTTDSENKIEANSLKERFKAVIISESGNREVVTASTCSVLDYHPFRNDGCQELFPVHKNNLFFNPLPAAILPNYQDYGYGIFLLDNKSRDYVIKNIQNEKDDFLRTMMWGSLWDSVREAELAPKDYVTLVIKNINTEPDESTINTLLNRVSTAMSYYLTEEQAKELAPQMENLLIQKMETAPTIGQRITYYRSFLGVASSEKARTFLKDLLSGKSELKGVQLKTKDKFDIVTKLMILSDADAPNLLAGLEKTETSDEAKRYAYAAKAGIATTENKAKFWNDFVNNKEISESWIESAFGAFNSVRHSELTLPYLEKALAELPNLKRNRKIFFVNGWLGAYIGGQKSEQALAIVNKFLADNPNLDKDLRLKILENADGLERAVKIRAKFKA